MPRDATATRAKLLRAGERLFAAKGVDGALVRDIVRQAGQANDSAVHYHFGSRQGLLDAILAKHIGLMEGVREVPGGGLDALVAAIVEPTAARLRSPDGRDFLRIIAGLAGLAGVRSRSAPAPLRGTVLATQLTTLERACAEFLPPIYVAERVAAMITMLTATLADRAGRIDRRRASPLTHEAFVADLVAMLRAALQAPISPV